MARKSRKQIAVEEPVIESVSSEVFSTAIYARLSVENSGKSEKVDVIANQIEICKSYILEHPGETFQVAPFIDRRCKHPVEEIQAAVDGAISHQQAVKLRECLQHLDELEIHKTNVEKEILCLVQQYPYQLELLQTVPGFSGNIMTAIALISEIGADMSVFPSAKHLVSWAGCCPRNDQSSKKVKSTRISRAGVYLKPLLVQVANAVIKSDKCPECKERYRRIKARRGHKKSDYRCLPYASDRYLEHTLQVGALFCRRLSGR